MSNTKCSEAVPREFWVSNEKQVLPQNRYYRCLDAEQGRDYQHEYDGKFGIPNDWIHVIEYSAYEALKLDHALEVSNLGARIVELQYELEATEKENREQYVPQIDRWFQQARELSEERDSLQSKLDEAVKALEEISTGLGRSGTPNHQAYCAQSALKSIRGKVEKLSEAK